jgi:hypothetical protein
MLAKQGSDPHTLLMFAVQMQPCGVSGNENICTCTRDGQLANDPSTVLLAEALCAQ